MIKRREKASAEVARAAISKIHLQYQTTRMPTFAAIIYILLILINTPNFSGLSKAILRTPDYISIKMQIIVAKSSSDRYI